MRQAGSLLGKAETQELVENIAGLWPEPRDHFSAHAITRQQPGVKLEHRFGRGLVRPDVELGDDRSQSLAFAGALAQ